MPTEIEAACERLRGTPQDDDCGDSECGSCQWQRDMVTVIFAALRARDDSNLAARTIDAEQRCERLEAAAKAYRELATCYRMGERPSERLFTELNHAREALAAAPAKGAT